MHLLILLIGLPLFVNNLNIDIASCSPRYPAPSTLARWMWHLRHSNHSSAKVAIFTNKLLPSSGCVTIWTHPLISQLPPPLLPPAIAEAISDGWLPRLMAFGVFLISYLFFWPRPKSNALFLFFILHETLTFKKFIQNCFFIFSFFYFEKLGVRNIWVLQL